MAPPSWIILSTTARISDTPLPDDLALSLKVQAPPRVSVLTLAPRARVSPEDEDDDDLIVALDDPSGLLLVFNGESYCVLDVPAATLSYRLPQQSPFGDGDGDGYTKPGVIADPAGATGAFVLADFNYKYGSAGLDNALVRAWSRTSSWRSDAADPEDGDEVPDNSWAFDDVVSHDGNIWWIDSDHGLLGTRNAVRQTPSPLFRYVPLPDVDDGEDRLSSRFPDRFQTGLAGRRYVQLSDGKFRCVQIRKPKGHVHSAGAAPTFITMRTLIDPEKGDWTDPEYKLSFADIRASDTFKAAGLPEDKDPVFALIHPKNPDVLYFFLGCV